MDRVHSYAALDEIHAVDLDAIQDNAFGLAQASGGFVGSHPYLFNDGSDLLVVGPFGKLPIGTAAPISQSSSVPVAMSGLSSSTWYYLYVRNVSGSPAYDYDTNGPDSTLTFKSGDATRVYIGCFLALTSTTCSAFRMKHRRYWYRNYTSGHQLMSGSAPTSVTTMAASQIAVNAPPHCRHIELESDFVHSGAANLFYYVKGDTHESMKFSVDANVKSINIFYQELDESDGEFQYGASGAGTLTISCVGFME